MLAAFTRDPDIKAALRMPHDEARDLARKAAEVSRHYKLPAINPGHVAVAAFAAAAFRSGQKRYKAIQAIQARRAAEGAAGGSAVTGTGAEAPASVSVAMPAGSDWMPTLN
jgi:hypothetical protein